MEFEGVCFIERATIESFDCVVMNENAVGVGNFILRIHDVSAEEIAYRVDKCGAPRADGGIPPVCTVFFKGIVSTKKEFSTNSFEQVLQGDL